MSAAVHSPCQARVIELEHFEKALAITAKSKCPEGGALKLLLSFYAGLRVGEIASLPMSAVTDAAGQIDSSILISAENAKGKRARRIPMHPRIREALVLFRRRYPDATFIAIGRSPQQPQAANALTQWFRRVYREAGLTGCTSHSGRRTFITNLARCANEFHTSLHDVQRLAGHRRLDTTQTYIEPSRDVTSLVFSLGLPPRAASRRLSLTTAPSQTIN